MILRFLWTTVDLSAGLHLMRTNSYILHDLWNTLLAQADKDKVPFARHYFLYDDAQCEYVPRPRDYLRPVLRTEYLGSGRTTMRAWLETRTPTKKNLFL